jgi:CheY-like chemotaxis protein
MLPHRPSENEELSSAAGQQPRRQDAEVRRMTNCRILVVDDSEADVFLLSQLIALMGYTVQQAHDGQDALEKVKLFDPQLVLCDIRMPDMSGLEFARTVRETGHANICLIATSGYFEHTIVQQAESCGFDRCLVKPVEIFTLQQAIADYLPNIEVVSKTPE